MRFRFMQTFPHKSAPKPVGRIDPGRFEMVNATQITLNNFSFIFLLKFKLAGLYLEKRSKW